MHAMAMMILKIAILVFAAGLLASLACLLWSVHPGSMLSAGLLLLLAGLVGGFNASVFAIALSLGTPFASLYKLFSRIVCSLGIVARFNSLILILYHSFKVPDSQPV